MFLKIGLSVTHFKKSTAIITRALPENLDVKIFYNA